jgi:hypothetical protein
MTYQWVFKKSTTSGASGGIRPAYPFPSTSHHLRVLVLFVQIMSPKYISSCFSSVLCCLLQLTCKNHVLFVFSHILYCMGFLFYLFYIFTYTGVLPDFDITWWSCRLTITRRLLLMEQELFTRSKDLSSSPVLVIFVLLFTFLVVFCRPLYVPLSFFFLPLYCLSFDLRLLINPLISSNYYLFSIIKEPI